MKRLFFLIFSLISVFGFSQTENCNTSLSVLKKVFPKYEIKSAAGHKLFITEVWKNHATIPLSDCYSLSLNEDVSVIAFEIFMSDIPEDYDNMIKEKITKESEINKLSSYKGTGERLIQVIFYDLKNNKFIGKPEGFPLAELSWTEQDLMFPPRLDKIKTFQKIEGCTNTILLSIDEFQDTKAQLHYFFKFRDGKIMTKSLKTCIVSFQEKNNKLWLYHIENCEEVENEGATPENVFRLLFNK